ncbi:MAG: hypothetical protein RJA83_1261 [Pseudomonadota bacterium]|jgi:peptidoglycan/LPS O-acetylase OafA/YrhL
MLVGLDKKIPVFIPLSMSLMFFGTLWREASINNDKLSRFYCVWWGIVFTLSLPFICFLAYAVSYLFTYLSAVIFFIFASKIKITSKPFIFLGTVSYSMYLLHPFALEFCFSLFNLHNNFKPWVFLLYLVMVILLSFSSYVLIEKPSANLGRLIKARIQKKRRTSIKPFLCP